MIVIDAERCTGCGGCERACSLKHFGVCGTSHSRIRIHRLPGPHAFVPVICGACDDAVCMKVCPVNARVREDNGRMTTDADKCISCKGCLCACPFGASVPDPVTGKTMSCDLCGDDPRGPWCVEACAMQKALRFESADVAAGDKSRQWAGKIKDREVKARGGK